MPHLPRRQEMRVTRGDQPTCHIFLSIERNLLHSLFRCVVAALWMCVSGLTCSTAPLVSTPQEGCLPACRVQQGSSAPRPPPPLCPAQQGPIPWGIRTTAVFARQVSLLPYRHMTCSVQVVVVTVTLALPLSRLSVRVHGVWVASALPSGLLQQ